MKERVELSVYTNLGSGISSVESIVRRAKEIGLSTLSLADFNSVLSFPDADKFNRDDSFKMIYGVSLGVCYSEEKTAKGINRSFTPVTLHAKNQKGIRTIYELLSKVLTDKEESTRTFIYIDDIINNKENIIVGSARILFLEQDYLKVTPYQSPNKVRQSLAEGEQNGIPVVAVGDVYYSGPNDEIIKDVLYLCDETTEDKPLLSTKEMLSRFDYLSLDVAKKIVVDNSNLIADMVFNNVSPIRRDFVYKGETRYFDELLSVVNNKLYEKFGNDIPNEINERVNMEMKYIMMPYNIMQFYIAYKLCSFAHCNGYPTGIRGLAGSSYVAYLLGISEVDPIEFNLPWETFFGFFGDKVVDIDINFPDVFKEDVDEHLKEIYGEENVMRAGCVLKTYPYRKAKLMAEEYLYKKQQAWTGDEEEQITSLLCNSGIKNGEGIHPGGLVLVPEGHSIYEFTPLKIKNGVSSTHFDFHDLQDIGMLKVDILGHRAFTLLKKLCDKIKLDEATIPLNDKKTFELIGELDTFGVPEFGAEFVNNLLQICKPNNFSELVKICGLCHGTNVWTDNAENLISSGTASLSDVMASREDIFRCLLNNGADRKTAFKVMEIVRKGMAYKRQDINDYLYEIGDEYGLPKWWAESVCKIRYMFPESHAISYTKLALKIAYFKANYPIEFYKTYLEVVDDEELVEKMKKEIASKNL